MLSFPTLSLGYCIHGVGHHLDLRAIRANLITQQTLTLKDFLNFNMLMMQADFNHFTLWMVRRMTRKKGRIRWRGGRQPEKFLVN